MTDGTSQGLFIVVAIVIFGIFILLSQTVFGNLSDGVVGLFGTATDEASLALHSNGLDDSGEVIIEDEEDGEVRTGPSQTPIGSLNYEDSNLVFTFQEADWGNFSFPVGFKPGASTYLNVPHTVVRDGVDFPIMEIRHVESSDSVVSFSDVTHFDGIIYTYQSMYIKSAIQNNNVVIDEFTYASTSGASTSFFSNEGTDSVINNMYIVDGVHNITDALKFTDIANDFTIPASVGVVVSDAFHGIKNDLTVDMTENLYNNNTAEWSSVFSGDSTITITDTETGEILEVVN